jgi:DNA-binding NarL/FixJ family response regulator
MNLEKSREDEAGLATRTSRILIVDDHPITRGGIASLVGNAPDLAISGEAASEAEALVQLARETPDLAIVDIYLNNSSGLELIRAIRKRHRKLPILVLSLHDEALYAERALRVGAQGYIMKTQPPEELLRAIRVTLGHGLYVSPEVARQMAPYENGRRTKGPRPRGVATLSDKELLIFHMVGRGNPTRAIAGELHLSMKTVQTHYAHIKRKLNLRNLTELVQRAAHWVTGNGVRMPRRR